MILKLNLNPLFLTAFNSKFTYVRMCTSRYVPVPSGVEKNTDEALKEKREEMNESKCICDTITICTQNKSLSFLKQYHLQPQRQRSHVLFITEKDESKTLFMY